MKNLHKKSVPHDFPSPPTERSQGFDSRFKKVERNLVRSYSVNGKQELKGLGRLKQFVSKSAEVCKMTIS